jgi:hypothetical protein
VAFVLLADAALLLLMFLCLREFERGVGRGRDVRIKAAVWALMTLLMAMFASRVAPTKPPWVRASGSWRWPRPPAASWRSSSIHDAFVDRVRVFVVLCSNSLYLMDLSTAHSGDFYPPDTRVTEGYKSLDSAKQT